jgi:AGCS family alanine or glycine:cation symporter
MKAGFGGFLGILVIGFKRAAFSNEAGIGSAAIAHSAAKTKYAVREGIVSLLEPFIDTVVVCTMTGLVMVITGAYVGVDPDYAARFLDRTGHDVTEFLPAIAADKGATVTSLAFGAVISWFPYVLSVAVCLFAFSTLISWSYYGERCWAWMFGDKASMSYRIIFLIFTFLGSILSAKNVLEFGDLMILGMAFPNILGVVLLSGKVKTRLDEYWAKLKAGELPTYK